MWKFRVAVRDLSSARLRTILTILGVIIGSGLIVATLVGGQSASDWVASRALGAESKVVILSLGEIYPAGGFSLKTRPIFDESIVRDLAAMPDVEKVYPIGFTFHLRLDSKGRQMLIASGAVFADQQLLEEFEVKFVDRVQDKRSGVIILKDIAERLGVNVGESILVEAPNMGLKKVYEIVGVLERPGSLLGSIFITGGVYLPLEDWNDKYVQLYLIVRDIEHLEIVESQSVNFVKQNIGIEIPDMDIVALSLSQVARSSLRVINTVIDYIFFTGILSLAIGGIGVTNVMLMNMKERIREIGILKSIGTRDGDVFALYLIESSLIGIAGGILGLIVGVMISFAATQFLLKIPFSISVQSLAAGPLVGVITGLMFGIYPALKAYRMTPGEALRWEW